MQRMLFFLFAWFLSAFPADVFTSKCSCGKILKCEPRYDNAKGKIKRYFFIFFGIVFCGMSSVPAWGEFHFNNIPEIHNIVHKCCDQKDTTQDLKNFISTKPDKINESALIPMYGDCKELSDKTCISDGNRTALDFAQGLIKISTNASKLCKNLDQCKSFESLLRKAGAKTYDELHPTGTSVTNRTTEKTTTTLYDGTRIEKIDVKDADGKIIETTTKRFDATDNEIPADGAEQATANTNTSNTNQPAPAGAATTTTNDANDGQTEQLAPQAATGADSDTNNPEKGNQQNNDQSATQPATETNSDTDDAEKEKSLEEKQAAYDEAKEKEQSTANRMLGGLTTAATGIGGMQLAQGLAEKSADKDAEADMATYIATMRCSYAYGKSVKFSTEEIELPGANNAELMKLRNEYFALASDLKERKTALGMKPGIESEEILDKATSGLYDDEFVGIDGGNYASLYRATALNSELDQKQIADEQKKSKNRVIAGGVLAGAGVAGGILGNSLINGKLGEKIKEKKANKNAEKEEKEALKKLKQCLKDGGATNTNKLEFKEFTPSVLHLEKIYCSGNDWTQKVKNKEATNLFADTTDETTIKTTLIKNFDCDITGKLLNEDEEWVKTCHNPTNTTTPQVTDDTNLPTTDSNTQPQNTNNEKNTQPAPTVVAPDPKNTSLSETLTDLEKQHAKDACESDGISVYQESDGKCKQPDTDGSTNTDDNAGAGATGVVAGTVGATVAGTVAGTTNTGKQKGNQRSSQPAKQNQQAAQRQAANKTNTNTNKENKNQTNQSAQSTNSQKGNETTKNTSNKTNNTKNPAPSANKTADKDTIKKICQKSGGEYQWSVRLNAVYCGKTDCNKLEKNLKNQGYINKVKSEKTPKSKPNQKSEIICAVTL